MNKENLKHNLIVITITILALFSVLLTTNISLATLEISGDNLEARSYGTLGTPNIPYDLDNPQMPEDMTASSTSSSSIPSLMLTIPPQG